jgi:hypothetical protein
LLLTTALCRPTHDTYPPPPLQARGDVAAVGAGAGGIGAGRGAQRGAPKAGAVPVAVHQNDVAGAIAHSLWREVGTVLVPL